MTPGYTLKLGLKIRPTNIGAQKIDGSTLETFKMVLASFQVEDMFGKTRFFQTIFLLADLSIEVVLEMPFLIFNNADIKFAQKKLTWRFYIAAEALLTTKQVEIINGKEFAKAALDDHVEAFMVHVIFLLTMAIHPARKAQIALRVAEKVQIPTKYSDFLDVFLEEKALILPKATELNQYAIELQDGQQPLYRPIYNLSLMEPKILKLYIETNLANGFIRPLKSPASALILFVGKPDGSLCPYVNYRGLNNLTIKN